MNVYDIITDRIVRLLESGTAPWRKPWASHGLMPANLTSGKEYRGINAFLLHAAGYASPYWLTFKQAKELGGSVRKGEHGTPCVFWQKGWDRKEEGEVVEHIDALVLRYYTVFNASQCEGIEVPAAPKLCDFQPIEACERIVGGMPSAPRIENTHVRAFYRPATDLVGMPTPDSFVGAEAYYATLFHELTHATGHASRLNRAGIAKATHEFGSADYSREELVAEMGSAFLCGHAGISPVVIDNQAAYLSGWIAALKGDPKLAVMAAAQAQKAADHILGRKFE